MWNVSSAGVDIMEFFGNIGRPGTSREQSMNDRKQDKKPDKKWNADGSKL